MDVESYKVLPMNDYKKLSNENYAMHTEIGMLKNENKLLKEQLKELKGDITRAYYTMISLDKINEKEIEEI